MPRLGVHTSGLGSGPSAPEQHLHSLRMGLIYTTISRTLHAAQIVLAERYTLAYLRLYRIKNKVIKYETRNVSQELFTPTFLSQEYRNTGLK